MKLKEKLSAKIVFTAIIDKSKQISKNVVTSKKNCNQILELFEIIQEHKTSEEISVACIRALHKIFCHYLEAGEMQYTLPESSDTDDANVSKFRQWLKDRYSESRQILLEYLLHEFVAVKELSLCTLMKYVETEGKKQLVGKSTSTASFPVSLFEKIIESLVQSAENQEELIERFQEYLDYDDVRHYYMKYLLSFIKQLKTDGIDSEDLTANHHLTNTLMALSILKLPPNGVKLSNMLIPVDNAISGITSVKAQRELYTRLWLEFFNTKLTSAIYKKILIALPDKIIPHLSDPLVVSDWLLSCYDKGGAVSLMALNGLFILMTQHSLEYPDFYTKLYSIMSTEIFSVKYMARFFHLLDMFLQSLLLPTYITAAFIKKLARMALTAPPSAALLVIEFIINLLIRHNTCRFLIHRDTCCDEQTDPFLPLQADLSKCRAAESSLWEIKTLQKHWHHRVATEAKRIEQVLPKVESSLDVLLEGNYDALMKSETRKVKKAKSRHADVALNHSTPSKLFKWECKDLEDLWICQD